MDKSELDDAHGLIEEYGLQPSDFKISSTNSSPNGDGIQPEMYVVSIQKGIIKREYQGGHGRTWLVDFSDDLKKMVFV